MRYPTRIQHHVFRKILVAILMMHSSTLMAAWESSVTTKQTPQILATPTSADLTASIEVDKAELQTLLRTYSKQQSVVDALNASYVSYGQAYTSDSPSITPAVPDDGTGGDTTWTPLTFTDTSAASALGYANNLCAMQPASTILTTLGVRLDEQKFEAVKTSFCKLVQTAAHLKNRYDKYQSIKADGITLVSKHKKQKNSYAGHDRTVQGWIVLKYYPDVANTATNGGVPDLKYDSYFQWSDDKKMLLDIIQSLRTLTSSGKGCDGVPIILSDRIKFYTNVVGTSASSVTIENCISGRAYNETKTLTLPQYTIRAPFGYMAELEAMKDSAKSTLLTNMQNKIIEMVSHNDRITVLVTHIQTAQEALAKMSSKNKDKDK